MKFRAVYLKEYDCFVLEVYAERNWCACRNWEGWRAGEQRNYSNNDIKIKLFDVITEEEMLTNKDWKKLMKKRLVEYFTKERDAWIEKRVAREALTKNADTIRAFAKKLTIKI